MNAITKFGLGEFHKRQKEKQQQSKIITCEMCAGTGNACRTCRGHGCNTCPECRGKVHACRYCGGTGQIELVGAEG